MKQGFTLAEVLITLGIIGVVAAMTIPTLMANIKGSQYRAKFKKGISNLSQTGLIAQEQLGFSYGDSGITSSSWIPSSSDQNIGSIMLNTQKGVTYIGYYNGSTSRPESYKKYTTKIKTIAFSPEDSQHSFILPDGMIVGLPQYSSNCTVAVGESLNKLTTDQWGTAQCVGYIDVNGINLPNEETVCSDKTISASEQRKTDKPCVVKPSDIKDIFPIVFHDSTVEPASAAAKYVLNTAK